MKINFKRKDLFTIPNILSYIRLILIPVIVILYVNAKSPRDYYIATVIFAICTFTDILDGYIARHYNQITDLGKILDPIADKAMQAAILICLVIRIHEILPIFILFAIKEIFMGIAGFMLLKTGRKLTGAKWFGKICTVVLDTVMVILFAFPTLSEKITGILLGISVVFMVFSFVMYAIDYIKIFKEK